MTARKAIRILLVIDDMGIGGAQKQIAELTRRLDPDHFAADIVCIERGGPFLERSAASCKVEILGARRLWDNQGAGALARLSRIIKSGGYDIVEAYLPSAHLLCAAAIAGRRRPALVAARRHMAELDPAWMRLLNGFLKRATLFSIANSRAVKASVVARYGLSPARVAVIPNIVENCGDGIAKDHARSVFGVDSGDFVVAAAGTLSLVKDYPTILKAVSDLRTGGRRCVLLVAGEGARRREIADWGRRLGLNGQLRLLGAVPNVRTVLAAADVFVHASLSEGFCNAILEAMAAGLPVVSSDIPASREALGEECGLFFAPGNWRGCREAIETFSDPVLAGSVGEKGRARLSRFAAETVMRKRTRLYRRISEVVDGTRC